MGQEGWGHNETERNDFICVHICNIHIACLTNTKKSGFDFCRPIFVKTQGKLISPNIQGIDTDRVFGKKNLQATCQEFAREKTLCLKKAFLPETKPGAMHFRRRVLHACKEKGKRQQGESWQAALVLYTQVLVFSFTPALSRSFWRHVHLHAWEKTISVCQIIRHLRSL